MNQPRVSLWGRDRLYVGARLTPEGALVIEGQDLSGASEYEYALTVPAAQVPQVLAGLAGRPGDDVLALLKTHAATIVETGELTWLRSLGIEPEFWSRRDM